MHSFAHSLCQWIIQYAITTSNSNWGLNEYHQSWLFRAFSKRILECCYRLCLYAWGLRLRFKVWNTYRIKGNVNNACPTYTVSLCVRVTYHCRQKKSRMSEWATMLSIDTKTSCLWLVSISQGHTPLAIGKLVLVKSRVTCTGERLTQSFSHF